MVLDTLAEVALLGLAVLRVRRALWVAVADVGLGLAGAVRPIDVVTRQLAVAAPGAGQRDAAELANGTACSEGK